MRGGWKFPPLIPNVLIWWIKVLFDLWLKWGSVLTGEYPLNWYLAEILMLIVGLSYGWGNTFMAGAVAGAVYAVGFTLYHAQDNFTPWLFALNQSAIAAGAGFTATSLVRLLEVMGFKVPKLPSAGGIIAVGNHLGKEQSMAPHVPQMTSGQRWFNHAVAVVLAIGAGLLILRNPEALPFVRIVCGVLALGALASLRTHGIARTQRVLRLLLTIVLAALAAGAPLVAQFVR